MVRRLALRERRADACGPWKVTCERSRSTDAVDSHRALECGTAVSRIDRRADRADCVARTVPNTDWLKGCLALDDKGFIKTGPALSPDDLAAAGWPLTRPPYLLEASRPGIFAVGDVRGGNVKRCASAVGEGSIAVAFVHQVLQE